MELRGIQIRQENKDDFENVYELNKIAFQQDNEARLVNLPRVSNAFIPQLSLVATLDNEIIGHILFTKNKIINDN